MPDVIDIKRAQLDKFDPTAPLMRVVQVATKAAAASESQLEKIRPYLLRDFDPAELYIRQMELANDQVDRSYERFDMGYLRRFRETIVGKSVLIGHEYGTAPVGRFFDVKLGKGTNGWQWVMPWFYMPISPGNQLARDNIDSGVWSYVSIGAYVDYAGLICDICGKAYFPWLDPAMSDDQWSSGDYCKHIKGQEYEGEVCTTTWTSKRSDMSKVEAVEGSIVYLGCQYEAAIAKSAEQDATQRHFKATMLGDEARALFADMKKLTAEPEPSNDPQPQDAPAAPVSTAKEGPEMDLIERLKSLLGLEIGEPDAIVAEIERRSQEADELRKQAGDATTLKEWLTAEVSRLADCVENPIAKTLAEKSGAAELIELHAQLSKQWSEKRSPQPQATVETPTDAAQTTTRAADNRAFSVI